MVVRVRKRDGTVEPYTHSKITAAVIKAMEEADEVDSSVAERVADKVASNPSEELGVEEIQDIVENVLMASRCKQAAKAYIKYRDQRSRERAKRSELNRKVRDVLICSDVKNQNANVDEYSFGGRKFESANILHKDMALNEFMRPEVAQAHRESRLYIHDLSEYTIGDHNCLFADVPHLLANGFSTRNGDVRPANGFSTACQLLAVIFQVQSQVQFGGVASCHLDYDLAPYVRKSFYRHFLAGCKWVAEYTDGDITFIADVISCSKLSIDDSFFTAPEHEKEYAYAMAMLEREGKQSAQALYHNLNTLESRAGSQIPFTSINGGTDTSPEGRLVYKWLMEASLDGIGKLHTTPIFPISIFQYKKGVNANPGDPNYDLKKLSIKSLSKRIYPNIVNCGWSQNVETPGNPDTQMATMG